MAHKFFMMVSEKREFWKYFVEKKELKEIRGIQ